MMHWFISRAGGMVGALLLADCHLAAGAAVSVGSASYGEEAEALRQKVNACNSEAECAAVHQEGTAILARCRAENTEERPCWQIDRFTSAARQRQRGFATERQRAAADARDEEARRTVEARSSDVEPPPAPRDPIADWVVRAPAQCRIELNHRACSAAPAGATDAQRAECTTKCKEAVETGLVERVTKEIDRCALAEGAPACSLNLAFVDINGPTGKQVTEEGRAKMQDHCLKKCTEKRAESARLAKEAADVDRLGEGLIVSYKRCMMQVDQTREARREELYDRDLYDLRMSKANERCRKQNRCDWIEDYSELGCVYGN